MAAVEFTTLGVEISANRSQTWIALAGQADGRAVVELLDPVEGTDAVPAVVALRARHPITTVVVDPRSNAATLLAGLAAAGVKVMQPDVSGMAVAWGRFHDWTIAGRLKHRGHEALTAAVREAVARRTAAGAVSLERRGGDPAPLVAAELAVLALAGDEFYDVLESVW